MAKSVSRPTLCGVSFVAFFALACSYLAEIPWVAQVGISSLIIAILLGIIYANTLGPDLPSEWKPGFQFAAKRLLRLAIILYGFRISFQQIAAVGTDGLLIDLAVVALTLLGGSVIGVKYFKLDKHLSILISAGAAICGAAAVLAVEDVLKSEPYKTSVAVATVVLFGTLAMFLYPVLYRAGLFHFTEAQFGVFAGASVHEVAQALVAGDSVGKVAGNVAVIVKMTRVLLLVPVLFILSLYVNRSSKAEGKSHKIVVPWFAIGFVGMIGVNSLQIIPEIWVSLINRFDIFLLTMAMGAIGLETHFSKMKSVGLKPFYLSILLFLWLTVSVYFGVSWLI